MQKIIGRPKTFDKDEVVAIAMEYFWEHGYDNSSLDDLLKAMNIKKSSFYQTFKSKEELFSLTLDVYRKKLSAQMLELKNRIGPKNSLLALSENTIKELKETGKVRGCLIINSGKECYNRYMNLSHQVSLDFNSMKNLISSFVKEAQERGEISKIKNADAIAGRYLNTLNGLTVTIQAGASQSMIDDVVESLKEILE